MSTYDSEKKIWSSNGRTSIYNPNTSLGEIVLYALDRTPDKICEISDDYGSFLTCFEVRNRSILVAENLRNVHGIKFGDVCAVVSRNNPEVSSVVFGCLFIGAPLNTLDPSFDQNDLDHMLGLTKPKVIFAEKGVLNKIEKSTEKLRFQSKIFCFTSRDGTVPEGIDSVSTLFDSKRVSVDLEDYLPVRISDTMKHNAFIICSSGTTGLSKGVCVSHAQVVSQTLRFWPVDSSDTTFAFSSLYWISGIVTLLEGVVEGAIRIVTAEPFSPSYLLRLIEKHKVTHVFMPPSQIAQCLESKEISKADLTSIRLCLCGGSFVLEELRSEFEKHLGEDGKVIVGYGMSEIGCACTITIGLKTKPGSVGGVVNQHQIKILSEEGEALGPDDKGEVCVFTPYPFLGYYGNEDELKEIQDMEGWIHSGDLGYFDEEGYLFIIGRKKEIIKYRNHQVRHVFKWHKPSNFAYRCILDCTRCY